LRGVGLSSRKVEYLKDLAHKFSSGLISENKLKKLEDDEVVKLLTGIRGIGPWTAEMFLIFGLGRPNVFSVDDMGLRRAMEKLYGNGKTLHTKELVRIASRWSPYRSVACLYLWKWYDGVDGL
jgi:DNA-3-methyladenine glycosylase II